jgi:hypothetical protein
VKDYVQVGYSRNDLKETGKVKMRIWLQVGHHLDGIWRISKVLPKKPPQEIQGKYIILHPPLVQSSTIDIAFPFIL